MWYSSSTCAKETLEWLKNDIFGKVVQLNKGVVVGQSKISNNLNENIDNLIPISKIFYMVTNRICGQIARDFVKTKNGIRD